MTVVDWIAGPLRVALAMFGRPQQYVLHDGGAHELRIWLRGVREDDLFAGAQQQDQAAVLDAAAFRTAFPTRDGPQRFDRVQVAATATALRRSYSVEEWRGAPNDDAPVFFKLLLRGGSQ